MSTPMFTGPQPPETERWCTVCAFMFKGACLGHIEKETSAVSKDGQEGLEWFDLEKVARQHSIPFPKVAVATGIFAPMSQTGLMELCWSHLMGINLKAHAVIPASMMPGQPGGGVLLGGG